MAQPGVVAHGTGASYGKPCTWVGQWAPPDQRGRRTMRKHVGRETFGPNLWRGVLSRQLRPRAQNASGLRAALRPFVVPSGCAARWRWPAAGPDGAASQGSGGAPDRSWARLEYLRDHAEVRAREGDDDACLAAYRRWERTSAIRVSGREALRRLAASQSPSHHAQTLLVEHGIV